MQSILTVISGENTIDMGAAPALCDPLVEAGLIESWRISTSVQGVTLILKEGTTRQQRRALIKMIEKKGLQTIEK